MAKPLQAEDPGELGPFRLSSRLKESPAGIVYLGADAQGRPVEVALLTAAAAADAAARDRFRTAVSAEAPRPGPVADRGASAARGGPAPVVAALVEGSAPWVATAHAQGLPGAGRFLEPVLLKRGWGRRRLRGPHFQPHWLSGPRGPAVLAPKPPPTPPVEENSRALVTAVASLAALLGLLGLLLALLFACEPSQPTPPPAPPPPTLPVRPPPPVATTPAPSPTTGRPSGSPTPLPTLTGGDGTLDQAGRRGGP